MVDEPTKEQPMLSDEPGPELVEQRRPGNWARRLFWSVLTLGLVTALVLGVNAVGLLPNWHNPFAEQKTDRSQPALLLSIKDLSRFVAAEGSFEVIIDLKKDRRFVPDWLLNQRTLFVAAGNVESFVDFRRLTDASITESADRTSAEIRLPKPELAEPKLDLERSYVFAEERGLINRVGEFFDGDPNRQRETMLTAEQKIADAAKQSGLIARAEENTRKALEGILHSLGYTKVTVVFAAT